MIENKKFWYDEELGEINLKDQNIKINIGSSQTVYIDKMYAPLTFCNIRITPVFETCIWRVERERITQDEQGNDVCNWEVICEFDAQESLL